MNTDYGPYWGASFGVTECSLGELHSVLQIVVCNWIIPACGLQVMVCSRRGELSLVAVSINLRISSKGCRIMGRAMEEVNDSVEGCSPQKGLSYLQMIWMMALG